MSGVLGTSASVFIGLTVVLFGLAAFRAGQAVAEGWHPAHDAVLAALGLTIADRFLASTLFASPPLSLSAALITAAYLVAVTLFAWRATLARKMVRQYPWLYRPAGILGWRRTDDT
jgi:uncharacterized protein DUF6867